MGPDHRRCHPPSTAGSAPRRSVTLDWQVLGLSRRSAQSLRRDGCLPDSRTAVLPVRRDTETRQPPSPEAHTATGSTGVRTESWLSTDSEIGPTDAAGPPTVE
jgi:hypothetical protein